MEGYEAWEVIQLGGLKYNPGGKITGFEIQTIMSMTQALGYDSQALAILLEYAELGLCEAVKNNGNSNTEHFNPDSGT